jgi:6-phosphogluconolactonase
MMPEFLVVPPESFAQKAAETIIQKVNFFFTSQGRCSIALSGGKTPGPVYEEMAKTGDKSLWKDVDFYFGDERCVPRNHPDSNFHIANEALFKKIHALPGNIHPMYEKNMEPEEASRLYGEILPDSLDILLLGAGNDGHIASIFPGSRALNEKATKVLPVIGTKEPKRRITITPWVIERAKEVIVLIKGESKAEIIEKAVNGPFDPMNIPLQLVINRQWILDEDAAMRLKI